MYANIFDNLFYFKKKYEKSTAPKVWLLYMNWLIFWFFFICNLCQNLVNCEFQWAFRINFMLKLVSGLLYNNNL